MQSAIAEKTHLIARNPSTLYTVSREGKLEQQQQQQQQQQKQQQQQQKQQQQ